MFIYPTLTTSNISLLIPSGQSIIVKSYGGEETTVQLQGNSYQAPLHFIQLATLFNNEQTFGPFGPDRTIRIQNRNATVEYEIGVQPALASSTPSTSLTDAQLRAAPVPTADAAATAKIEELRLQLVTLLGNTDTVETLQQNSINLLTLTNQYVDGLEALITSLGTNTDGLEGLLSTITGHVDVLEPLLTDLKTLATVDATKQDGHQATLTAISNKLPALGQAEMAASQPVTLASDQTAIPVTYAAVTRTPTMENVSAAGTVAAGAVMVSIVNTGTTSATVLGAQLLPGLSVTYALPKGEILPAISYTASATAPLTITRLA
jgi:hypothetical protein